MSHHPVFVYYMCCRELGCWVLFNVKPHASSTSTCRLHGGRIDITGLREGIVTEFEANQGWTKQKPDAAPHVRAQRGKDDVARDGGFLDQLAPKDANRCAPKYGN